MAAAQLQAHTRRASAEQFRGRFVQARFEALAEWGIPTSDALAIAEVTDIHIVDAIELLRHGCPSDLVLGILR